MNALSIDFYRSFPLYVCPSTWRCHSLLRSPPSTREDACRVHKNCPDVLLVYVALYYLVSLANSLVYLRQRFSPLLPRTTSTQVRPLQCPHHRLEDVLFLAEITNSCRIPRDCVVVKRKCLGWVSVV